MNRVENTDAVEVLRTLPQSVCSLFLTNFTNDYLSDITAEIVTGAPNAPASISQLGFLQPSRPV